MKLLVLLLAIASTSAAQQFGDDNQSGDWLPIPDGFVWPKAVDNAPEFRTTSRKFVALPRIQQEAIKQYWPDDEEPERVRVGEIDLNGDGRPEFFVGVPAYSGTGGAFYEILTLVDGKTYKGICGIQGWGFQFLTKKNGWFQIEGMSRGGGGHYTRYLMTFGAKEFEITRNEGHDFNTKKVTIRKTKAGQGGAHQPATRRESKSE